MHKSILSIIEKRNLVSIMNNTKWYELASEMDSNPEKEPTVSVKSIFEDQATGFSLMDWEFGIKNCTAFEWLDINPIQKIRVGSLVADKQISLHTYIENLLKKHGILYSIEGECFRVWGYHETGKPPKFV
jgi:hypothetical protein